MNEGNTVYFVPNDGSGKQLLALVLEVLPFGEALTLFVYAYGKTIPSVNPEPQSKDERNKFVGQGWYVEEKTVNELT